AGDSNEGRSGEEGRPHAAADEGDGEGDRERGYGVVARGRRLTRGRDEEDRVPGVRDEGARPLPELRDHLAGHEPEARGGHARERGDLPAVPGPGPVEEPEPDRRGGEERDRPDRDEVGDLLLHDPVAAEEIVQIVEGV